MLVPVNWLKEYVEIDVDTRTLADAMTMSGTKVEEVISASEEIQKVVVGKVLEVKQHPNADRLFVCRVHVGDKVLQIVTGASNVKEGNYVPVALEGALLPGGIKVNGSRIRGEESQGMMCSALELALNVEELPPDKKEGIYILDQEVQPGTDIRDVLKLEEEVIDFEITTNRPDCLSIIGIAREVSATFKIPLKDVPASISREKGDIRDYLKGVTIQDQDLCNRYIARVVDNVKIEPSPQWMQKRLIQAGIRPINNIVDITNYVMLEMGQPLHAFDLDTVEGREIIVRRAKEGEELVTLDGKKRILSHEDLVIADVVKATGIAGVMGGELSEVTENTRTILLESANFNGYSIRKTSKKLGLRSEASSRFEKGLDPNLAEQAINRAAVLIEKLGAGEVIKGIIDVYPNLLEPHRIEMKPSRINQLLGTRISSEEMQEILRWLGMKIEGEEGRLMVTVPTFRQDVRNQFDLAEEIARIYGYDRIPKTVMSGSWVQGIKSYNQKVEDRVKDMLCGCGMYEIMTFSFEGPGVFDRLRLPEDSPLRRCIVIKNPLGEDYSIMRTTLLPAMLNVVSLNFNRGVKEARLFEIAPRFIPGEIPLQELPEERKTVCLAMYGDTDFYSLKGVVEALLDELNISNYQFRKVQHPSYHPGRTAEVLVNGKGAGIIGEIHPDVARAYQVNTRVYAGELDFDVLVDNAQFKLKYTPLPRFPAVNRDIAILVDQDIEVARIEKVIKEAGGNLIEKMELFDIYKGKQIPEGKKSVAYSLVLRAKDRTLKDQEANSLIEKILDALKRELGAELR